MFVGFSEGCDIDCLAGVDLGGGDVDVVGGVVVAGASIGGERSTRDGVDGVVGFWGLDGVSDVVVLCELTFPLSAAIGRYGLGVDILRRFAGDSSRSFVTGRADESRLGLDVCRRTSEEEDDEEFIFVSSRRCLWFFNSGRRLEKMRSRS